MYFLNFFLQKKRNIVVRQSTLRFDFFHKINNVVNTFFFSQNLITDIRGLFKKYPTFLYKAHNTINFFYSISFKIFPLVVHTLIPALLPLLKTLHKLLPRNALKLLRRFFHCTEIASLSELFLA